MPALLAFITRFAVRHCCCDSAASINDDATGGEFEIEGSVGGLKGTCPNVQFSVNGFPVATSGTTTFQGGACSALTSGDKVTVNGVRLADNSVAATKVTRQ